MTEQSLSGHMSKALLCGMIGVLAVAIAPLLLTRLFESGQISAEAIGIAVCLEFIGMAAGSVIGARVLGAGRTGRRVLIVGAAMSLANLATPFGGVVWIIVARTLAGLTGGMLIWVTLTAIVRARDPERWAGLYLSGHTAVQFAAAALLAALVIPASGTIGGYAMLAAASLLLVPVALGLPDLRPQDAPDDEDGAYPTVTWVALASILLINAVFSSMISYAELEFQSRGFGTDMTILIVPVILGAQIIGGLVAAAIAPRLPRLPMILAVSGALALSLWALTQDLTSTQIYLGFALFGFCWLFIGPFQMGFVLNVTGSLHAGELLAAAQLIGLALGPLAAAAILLPGGYPPVAYHMGLLALSVVCLVAAYGMRRNRSAG